MDRLKAALYGSLAFLRRPSDTATETPPAQDSTPPAAISTVIDEHFVPAFGLDLEPYLECGDMVGAHHLLRYRWALRVIADRPPVVALLDVACGAGYGSYLLAQSFPAMQVVGADYDPAAVEHARRTYQLPNLEFRHGDVTRWEETIGPTVFACVTSFDTIEHCAHRELMLESLVAHLHPDGALLFSTPCGADVTSTHPEWEHHRIEYSTASLYDFLRRYFGAILRPDGPDFPHRDVFDSLQGTGISYALRLNPVVCTAPIVIDNPYR